MSHDRTRRSESARGRDPIDIAVWRQRVLDLPDLRWDKVTRLRNAIRADRYEPDLNRDEWLERIRDEVAALCDEDLAGVDLPQDE